MVTHLLSGPVAVVGSRHGSPYGVARFASVVVAAGGQVVTGCARGVDSVAASAALAAGRPAVIHRAVGQLPYQLAQRTAAVVAAAQLVAVFPPAGGQLGPGSALAIRTAQGRGLPVFVFGPASPSGAGWQAASLTGVWGWLWQPAPPAQPSLF